MDVPNRKPPVECRFDQNIRAARQNLPGYAVSQLPNSVGGTPKVLGKKVQFEAGVPMSWNIVTNNSSNVSNCLKDETKFRQLLPKSRLKRKVHASSQGSIINRVLPSFESDPRVKIDE